MFVSFEYSYDLEFITETSWKDCNATAVGIEIPALYSIYFANNIMIFDKQFRICVEA